MPSARTAFEHQRAPHLVRRRQPGIVPGGEHALAQVVDALKALAPGDHQLAGGEQALQHPLLRLPAPPAAARVGPHEVRGPRLAVLADVLQQARGVFPVRVHPLVRVPPAGPRVVQHAVAVERIVLHGKKAGLVRPVLEQRSRGQQLVQPARLVVAQPRPQHQVRAARHHADGVDLQRAHAADGGQHVRLLRAPARPPVQPLRGQHERAGGGRIEVEVGHGWEVRECVSA